MPPQLTGLDEVNWSELSNSLSDDSHDVPPMIRALLDPKQVKDAAGELEEYLLYGYHYEAALTAAPFIAEVAADPSAPSRLGALHWLNLFAQLSHKLSDQKYRIHAYDASSFSSERRTVLSRVVKIVLAGLTDPNPFCRKAVATLFAKTDSLSNMAVRDLQARQKLEKDPQTQVAITAALSAQGKLDNSTIKSQSSLVRFAAAWSALNVGKPVSTEQLDAMESLWNQCATGLEKCDVTDDVIAVFMKSPAELMPLLIQLTQSGGRGLGDAIRAMGILGFRRRDVFTTIVTTLIGLAEQAATLDIDSPVPPFERGYTRTARYYLAQALICLEPGVDETDHDRLINALSDIVTTSPNPAYARDYDIRAEALGVLIGRPGWQNLLHTILSDNEHVYYRYSPPGPDHGGGGHPVLLVADFVANQLCQETPDPSSLDLLCLVTPKSLITPLSQLSGIPPQPVQKIVLNALHTERHSTWLSPSVFAMLLRWRTPGTAELLAELAERDSEDPDQVRWSQLTLGVLTNDPSLIDQAFLQGPLKESYNSEFICLAGEWRTPAFLSACRTLITGTAATRFNEPDAQVRAAAVLGVDDLPQVWPTILSVVHAQGNPMGNAVHTALDLLGRYPNTSCRKQLVDTLNQILESGPLPWYGDSGIKDYRGLVWAAGALFDLVEAAPELAATHSLTMLQKLPPSEHLFYESLESIKESFRVLATSIPKLSPNKRKHIIKALQELLESPYRIPTDRIRRDIEYTTQIRNLLASLA